MFNSIYKLFADNSKIGLIGACALYVLLNVITTIITMAAFPRSSSIWISIIEMVLMIALIGGIAVLLFLGMDNIAKMFSIVAYGIWALTVIYSLIINIGRDIWPVGTIILYVVQALCIISISILYFLWKMARIDIAREMVPIACAAVMFLIVLTYIINIVQFHEGYNTAIWFITILSIFISLSAATIALFSYFNFFYNEKK